MFKYLTACTLALGTLSASVIEIEIDQKAQKSLKLTESQINRIGLVEGSIDTVIGNPNVFNVKIDENLGQAFITLKRSIEIPEGLTVVTNYGSTQDFLVTSEEGEPTVVYLSEAPDPIELFHGSLATIDTLSDIFEGKVPEGFGKRPLEKNESIEVGPLLEYIQFIDVYEGALETIYLINIANLSRKPLPLQKGYFEDPTINWIFSPAKQLKKNEQIMIAISKKRD